MMEIYIQNALYIKMSEVQIFNLFIQTSRTSHMAYSIRAYIMEEHSYI
jgi:hypothetical protein